MDPDTFGSMCALYLILKKLEKQVEAINDDTPPETFAFL
jgi:nanoRNase/pAp phosphatase (c-di-AMP/oligoRNAs hydrolase)